MPSSEILKLAQRFKDRYGVRVKDAEGMFRFETDFHQFMMEVGREVQQVCFEEVGKGYEGPTLSMEGTEYRYVGYRPNTVQGLYGPLHYRRAYYVREGGGSGKAPLDEKLGIEGEGTPGLAYFVSSFTSRGPYKEGLQHFHEIFRPSGQNRISVHRALEMDYRLGERIERIRQAEIKGVYEQGVSLPKDRPIEGTMVVEVDAAKMREILKRFVDHEGKRHYETGFKDAKIASISQLSWDPHKEEARCVNTSYVCAVEFADLFFLRITAEMDRRAEGGIQRKRLLVFLFDGADWIVARIRDLGQSDSMFILDFYHASEHLSDVCKALYGEETKGYTEHFGIWREKLRGGKVEQVLKQLRAIRDELPAGDLHHYLVGEINYFEKRKGFMRYNLYRQQRLPIGSGTVESGCKTVIEHRLKGSGMTWSERGANGMLQIRASDKSGRLRSDFIRTLAPAA
jgi:hypothetical protein